MKMAVNEFLTIKDAKQSVEKPVKEKPKLKDLVTVESPGKPSPALDLEESISVSKTGSILIITEKPQAAEKIAKAIGKTKSYKEDSVTYYEIEENGKTIYVCSAVG